MNKLCTIIALGLGLIASTGANATSQKDFDILGRALGFLSTPISGNVKIAIIHDASNPESQAHANELSSLLGSGLKVGKVTLEPVMVDGNSLSGLEGTKAAFVTDGLNSLEGKISSAASSKGIISIGNLPCVESGNCVLNVVSKPTVKIFVSKSAAETSGVSFADAFRMMITEK